METCDRCGAQDFTWRPWYIFKNRDRICQDCHDQFNWWYFVRAMMLGERDVEIPYSNLKETI